MRVGFVGIGNMGMGMALNILKAGYQVSAFDIARERLEEFEKLGGHACSDNEELGRNSDVVFVMTMTGQQAESALFGDLGVCEGIGKGSVIIVTASCGSEYIQKIAAQLPEGVELLDCPVTGGQAGAQSGTLTLMPAGKRAAFEKVEDILKACSQMIYYCGEQIGNGQSAKSCNQLVTGITLVATAEAMAMAAKVGLDPEVVTGIISNGMAGSKMFTAMANNTMDHKYENAGAGIMTLYKDMGIVMDIARQYEIPLQLSAMTSEIFKTAYVRNNKSDIWSVGQLYEEACGTKVERPVR